MAILLSFLFFDTYNKDLFPLNREFGVKSNYFLKGTIEISTGKFLPSSF